MACEIEIKRKDKPVLSIFTTDKLARYTSYMTGLVGDVFTNFLSDKNYTISQLSNPKIANEIYERVYSRIGNIISAHDTNFEVPDVDSNGVKLTKKEKEDYKEKLKTELPIGFKSNSDRLSEDILFDLFQIRENYKSFTDYHKLASQLFVTNNEKLNEIFAKEDIDDTENDSLVDSQQSGELSEEETSQKAKEYDKGANEEDPFKTMLPNVKILFSLPISRVYNSETGKLDIKKDPNGLPMPAMGNSLFTLLISKVNNMKDEFKLLEKIKDPELHKIIPELPQILKILNVDNWANRTDSQKSLWNQFHLKFSQPAVPLESLYRDKNGNVSKQNDIKGNLNKLRNLWKSNFNLDRRLSRDESGKTVFQKKNLPLTAPTTIEGSLEFLDSIGISISTEYFEENKADTLFKSINTFAGRLHATLDSVFKNDPTLLVGDILSQFASGFKGTSSETLSQSSTINALLSIESRYTTLVPTMSSRNSMGELQYLIANESNISLASYYLNNSRTLKELLESPPFLNLKYNPSYKASHLLNLLFDKNGNRVDDFSVQTSLISGQTDANSKGTLIRDFTDRQKLIFDFEMMLAHGKTDVMRLETSRSFYTLGISQGSSLENSEGRNKMYFEIDKFTGNWMDNNLVADQFLGYLNAEIERINSFDEKKDENPDLVDGYGEFNIFKKLSEGLTNKLKGTFGITKSDPLYKEFVAEYSEILNKELERLNDNIFKNKISEKQLVPSSLVKTNFEQLKKAYIMNSLVQNIEFSILYSGSGLFYDSMHKRLKGLSSTGTYTSISNTSNELVSSSDYQNTFGIKAQMKESGTKIPTKNSNQMFSQVINDKTGADYNDFYYKNGKDFKTTDGQGWIHPDTLQELSIRQEWNNDFTDRVFRYEALIFKRDIMEGGSLSKLETDTFNRLEKIIFDSPEEHSISVMKGGYFGPILNSTVDGKAYDKLSLAPLLPSMVKNHPRLKKLLLDMTKSNMDYVKYKSGTKGFTKQIVNIEDIGKKSPDVLSKNLFKLQIAYSNIAKETTSIPTQLLKLIYGNQFSSGESKSKEIKKLYDNYLKTLGDIQREQTRILFSELGLTKTENGLTVDYKKLSEKLLREAIARGMNSNIQYALRYNEKTNYLNSTPEIAATGEIEKLLSSITDKTLRRPKVNGGDFTLMTNAESPRLKFYKKDKNGVSKSEARVTLTKEFTKLLRLTHPDGEKIGTLARLNELIKTSWAKDNEKLLTIILDRVPTQELNSMDVAIVTEFLSPTIGNVIQLSDEIVAKAGSDFDFDKVKTLLPSFDNKGNYIEFDENLTSDVLDDQIIAKEEELEIFVKDNTKNIKDVIKDVKKLTFENYNKNKELKEKNKEQAEELYKNIGINLEIVKNSISTMEGLIKKINQRRNLQSYIKYKKDYTDFELIHIDLGTILDNTLNESSTELEKKLIDLYSLYKEKEDSYIEIQKAYDKFKDELGQLIEPTQYKKYKEKSIEYRELINNRLDVNENYANRIIDNYTQALLSPERFEELTRPNTAKDIEKIARDNAKRTGAELSLPKDDDVYFPTQNSKVFSLFFGSTRMLGRYAKTNTIQQLLAYAGTKLNTNIYKYWKNGGEPTATNIYDILLNTTEREKLFRDGGIDIGNNLSIDGVEKQLWNSQSINSTVDASKDPYFIGLALNYKNVGVEIILSLMGYPKERIIAFLSNNGIRKYTTNLENGLTKNEAKLQIIKRLGLSKNKLHKNEIVTQEKYIALNADPSVKITEVKYANINKNKDRIITYLGKELMPVGKEFNNLIKSIQANDFTNIKKSGLSININGVTTSLETLLNNNKFIDQNGWQELTKKENDIDEIRTHPSLANENRINAIASAELKALAFFFNTENVNFAYGNLSQYLSFDTAKLSGIIDIQKRRALRKEILNSNLVSEADLVKLENATPIAAFDNTNTIESIFNKFMPFISKNKNGLYSIIEAYNSNRDSKSKRGNRILPSSIQSDFMYSIMYNFGTKAKKGFKLLTDVNQYDENGKITSKDIVERLLDFKKSPFYNDIVKTYPIFDSIIANIHNREQGIPDIYNPELGVILNLNLIKNPQMSIVEEESIIYQFENLLNKEGIHPDPKFNATVKRLVTDMFDLALAQSGLQKSPFSFREYVPYKYYQQDSEEALKNFYALSDYQKAEYTREFANRFQYNNKTFFPKIIAEDSTSFTDHPDNLNNSQQNIKLYDIGEINNKEDKDPCNGGFAI